MSVEAKRSPAAYRLRRLIGNIGFGFSVLVLISPAILFFLWMLSLSFKNELDNTDWPPVFIPESPTLDNYREVFARNDFLRFAWNSIVVSFGATGIALLIGVPAGYGIAKMHAMRAAALILIARITPGLSYLIPLFLLFQWLGMTGSLTPIVITHLVITVPIVVWVMISFFEGLPPELEEAALVDGATIWQAFRYVAMPLARPGITVATILSFIFSAGADPDAGGAEADCGGVDGGGREGGLTLPLFRRCLVLRLINPQRAREAVEEAAKRDAEREFHNLRFRKMFTQPAKQAFRHAMAVFPSGHGIFRHQPVNWRQRRVINPPRQAFQSLGRDALHRQKRPVMIHAVITGIKL